MAGIYVGFRSFWVNRSKLPDEYRDFQPIQMLSDLGAIVDIA
jgi:hypothetical protein